MKLNEFAAENNIARSTAYYRAQNGALETYTDNNGIMRVKNTPALAAQSAIKKTLKQNIKSIKEQLDNIILYESQDKVTAVKKITEIVTYWESQGIKIKGYNPKSIYRKISQRKVTRQTRSDKWSIKNQALNKCFPKVRELAVNLYMADAEGKLNNVVDLILEYAKRNEDYYEVAAIPRSTLYRQLALDFKDSGFPTLHEYLNHYNRFKNTLPRVTGAFTDDIEFMDYIAGDDHKGDVASVFVYDEMLKKVVQKQVKIWSWNEPVTMMEWVYCKVGDLTAEDLVISLIPVLLEVGMPKKGLLIDNGIGRSDYFKDFWEKLTSLSASPLPVGEGKGEGQTPHYSAAYEPTNKATKELAFRIFKQELDAFQKNFVTPHKEDSRHTTAALSPEGAMLFFEDYKKKLNNYVTGYYIERTRTRTIKGKKERISIKDYFNRCWLPHQKIEVSSQHIRWALSKTEIKKYNNGIKIGREDYISAEPLPVSYNGKSFTFLINPFDNAEIDMYANEEIMDRVTGECISKGRLITTLYNTRLHSEKRKLVFEHQKKIKKALRIASENITAVQELSNAMPDTVAPNAEILKEREDQIKQTQVLLEQKINQLPAKPLRLQQDESSNSALKDEPESLTYEEG